MPDFGLITLTFTAFGGINFYWFITTEFEEALKMIALKYNLYFDIIIPQKDQKPTPDTKLVCFS